VAITTEAGLLTAIQTARKVRFLKTTPAVSTSIWLSTFRVAGQPAPATATPTTTGNTLTRTSLGALPIQEPSGTSYLAEFEAASASTANNANPTCVALADRLVEFGGLSSIVTTAQAVSALALPTRASSATDVELWLEVYVIGGATASPVATASYTNQSGTASRTATIIGGIPASGVNTIHRSFQFSLQAGDTGVQSVQSLTLGTSSGTAGNIGLVLRRTLLTGYIPVTGYSAAQTWAETDLQQVADNACLEVLHRSGSMNVLSGSIRLAQG
jgi:hypothetical protein